MISTPRMRMALSLVTTTRRWATFKAIACIYDSAKAAAVPYLMSDLLKSCRCQALGSGRSISPPRWRASCVAERAGDERKEAGMLLFSLLARDSKTALPASTAPNDVARVCVKAAGACRSSRLDPHQCVELRCS